tara:strand:+ start:117 stop:356 length:240 start_codon:yes stop_codon:yes gene_type:complete
MLTVLLELLVVEQVLVVVVELVEQVIHLQQLLLKEMLVELTQGVEVLMLEVVVEQPLQELLVEVVTDVEVQEHQMQLQE